MITVTLEQALLAFALGYFLAKAINALVLVQ